MNKRIPIFIGILLTLFTMWVQTTDVVLVRNLITRLESIGYDLQLKSTIMTHPLKPDPTVVIVDIDDKSLKEVGRWPWSRSKVAELVKALNDQGAVVIAFDIFFAESQDNIITVLLDRLKQENDLTPNLEEALSRHLAAFDHDKLLAKELEQSQTILAYTFLYQPVTQNALPAPLFKLTPELAKQIDIIEARGYIGDIPILQEAAKKGGFVNIIPDDDGIVRRAPLVMEYQGNVYASLALQAVVSFLGAQTALVTPTYHGEAEMEGIKLGRRFIPTGPNGRALIPFVGKSYSFPYYSAVDVLNKHVPEDALLGKIVFVGSSATGLGDLQPTSVQNPFPGVEIQATLASGLIDDTFSSKPAWTLAATLALTVFFGCLSAVIFPYLSPRILSLVLVLFPIIMFYANNYFWQKTGLIISALLPTMLVGASAVFNMMYGYLFESRRREQLKQIFGQYVPESHINDMLKAKSEFSLQGESRDMSVLFTDIQGFTTMSEGLQAHDLVEMLNVYFTPMTELVHKHVGTIDKYVGDEIIAFWGAPMRDKNHAYHAILTAVEMQEALVRMREDEKYAKWPAIRMGIGINSGMMNVGDMGSQFRRNYTVIGDSVNLAARVEGLTRFYGVDIIVTEYTRKGQTKFAFRKLDKVLVKGKKQSVEIYEVLGLEATLSEEKRQALVAFDKALSDYYAQDWASAESEMAALYKAFPKSKLYALYLERIKEYKASPPPKDWDGVFTHKTK